MKILTCNSNRPLAEAISASLNLPLTKASVRRFSDLEIFVEILENVRGEDVFIIQSTSYPANDNLMELLVTCDALRRGSARRITAVIPYYGYARQDRKSGPRTPISAKLVANLITTAGANRVVTLDLHAGQIQGFFDIPTDNLFSAPVFVKDIQERFKGKELVVVSPDVGGVVRARAIAKRIDADLAIIDKRRRVGGHEHYRRGGRPLLHSRRRHRRYRRHAVQRGGGAQGSGCYRSPCLCRARRAVGRRRSARVVLADQVAGDHRQHPGD
jgi:ribose-phosphate pyrophosphokinase